MLWSLASLKKRTPTVNFSLDGLGEFFVKIPV